jgi:hypothetical protein
MLGHCRHYTRGEKLEKSLLLVICRTYEAIRDTLPLCQRDCDLADIQNTARRGQREAHIPSPIRQSQMALACRHRPRTLTHAPKRY